MRRFFSDGIADFITELAETVEQNAPGKAHTSNHYAEYETLGFDYLKTASGFVDYPGIGFSKYVFGMSYQTIKDVMKQQKGREEQCRKQGCWWKREDQLAKKQYHTGSTCR